LEPLIRQRILFGTHIISDKWAAYGFLADDSDYFYDGVKHSNNFVDPENRMIHTQSIESCWMNCKRILRNQFGTHEHFLEGYLFEFCFRKAVSMKEKTFNELLIVIVGVNELHISGRI
jgi:hypothetical protein